MSHLIHESGKRIDSCDCFRLNFEDSNDSCLGSYSSISNYEKLEFSDYYCPKYFGYSDYSGSTYSKSNHELFIKDFGDIDGVKNVYGGYGSSDIYIRIDVLNSNKEIQECLNALEDYPVIDEDHLCEVEEEAKSESWNSYTRKDFLRALNKEFSYNLEKLSDDFIDRLFRNLEEHTNVYWIFEYTSAYFPLDEMISKRLTREDFLDVFKQTREEFSTPLLKEVKELTNEEETTNYC